MSGRASVLLVGIGAFLLGVALPTPLVTLPRPVASTAEMRDGIQRQLDLVWSGRIDRTEAIRSIATCLSEHPAGTRAALTPSQIDEIAPLIFDANPEVSYQALDILSRIGPSARPAVARVRAYLRSRPSLQFDRKTWDIEFTLRDTAASIEEISQLTSTMHGRSLEEQSEVARRIGMLASGIGSQEAPSLAPAADAIAAILNRTDAPYHILVQAAFALGSLGPRAKNAIPAIERALKIARAEESEFVVCAGFCPPLAENYERALKCIKMTVEAFEIARRFDDRPCLFFHSRENGLSLAWSAR